jgi:transposase
MQKAMELMNIKLGNVISDILGKSGQDIIQAIIKGERDPQTLSLLADARCKASKEVIQKSLDANWDEDQVFMLKQSYDLYLYYQQQMRACDKQIEKIAKEYLAQIDTAGADKLIRSNKKKSKKNEVTIDVEKIAFQMWGVNLMLIPSISDATILRLIGELGHDFTEKFESYKQFSRWCNLCPNNKISGGKLLSSKIPKRKNPVGQILRQAANSLKASKTPLGFYFRRMQSRNGYLAAIVATANKLARIIYTLVKTKTEYDISRDQITEEEVLKRKLINAQRALEKIQKQIKKAA